ncbi:hypothetical protein JXA40_07285 [bacterium]|nr:hypothetical protein [candidate division CSSED10-310 bacterium]
MNTGGNRESGREQSSFNRNLLVGVGGVGSRLVQRIQWRTACPLTPIVIDRADVLTDSEAGLCIALDPISSNHPRGDMIVASRDAERILPELHLHMPDQGFIVLVAGLGGGVGSGVMPVITRHLKQSGMNILALLIMPDRARHGRKCCLCAELALTEIRKWVDGCIILNHPNGFEEIADSAGGAMEASVCEKLQVVMDALYDTGVVSIDMSTVQNIISMETSTAIAVASADGRERGRKAAEQVLADPLLSSYMKRPASIIVHFLAGNDLTLFELDEAASWICENWGSEVDLTYGASMDPSMDGTLRLGIIVGAAPEREIMLEVVRTDRQAHPAQELQNVPRYPVALAGN